MSLIGKQEAMHKDAYVKQKQFAPETCVALEDSVFGLMAAHAAFIKYIVVATGYYFVLEPDREKPDTPPGKKKKIFADIRGPDTSGVGA